MGRNYSPKSYAGFTLIELLVVVSILGIIAAGVMLAINPGDQFKKTRDARRKSDLSQIQKALETYYNDNGKYPVSTGYKIDGIDWGLQWSTYMGTLPKDPSSSRNYVYCAPTPTPAGSAQSYYLYASLENGGPLTANNCSTTTIICGTGVPACNYGVSSPNVSP